MKLQLAISKAAKALWNAFPLILGTILLISLISTLIPKTFYTTLFQNNLFTDSLIGTILGSLSAGNPVSSYIWGGEMLKEQVSLTAVTAFLVAWVTVGVIQFPAEAIILGKKFAFWRNLLSFLFAMIIAWVTVWFLSKL